MSESKLKPGERIAAWGLHKRTRDGTALLAAALLGWGLAAHGYPWWLWAPACFLTAVGMVALWYMIAYGYQKRTYPRRAAEAKARRKQNGA